MVLQAYSKCYSVRKKASRCRQRKCKEHRGGNQQFALNTKAAWALRLDDILADALELGALRTEEYVLPQSEYDALKSLDLNTFPFEVVCNTVAYYEANKSNDSE